MEGGSHLKRTTSQCLSQARNAVATAFSRTSLRLLAVLNVGFKSPASIALDSVAGCTWFLKSTEC